VVEDQLSRSRAIVALVIVLALALPAVPGKVVALPAREADRCDDADLVWRAKRGDEWAHEMMYRRYVRLVASVAQRMLRNPTDVEDVVQETFLIAFEKIDQLGDARALKGWLARIAVSRVHRRFRFRKWLWSATELAASLEDQASEDATPEQRAELALIDDALSAMSLALRTPWILRHVLGHELADIASACECSLATAKRRISEADELVARHVKGEP
jgi:RNA polymerase sigma-70 factor (ECF subfamily)